ncbi:MAG: hypothetical protein ABI234_14060 [Ktedonobacteraceae bacterium]
MDYIYMARQRLGKRQVRGCISSLVVIALIVGGLGFVISRAHNGVAISVGAHPSVVVHDCNQPIIVRVGQANQVVLSGIFPQYGQDTTTNTIELGDCGSVGGFSGVTLIVPPHTNLQLDTNDSITVFDVSGQMKLSANGSRITLVNVALEGQSKIDDNGGVITLMGSLAQDSTSTISGNSGAIDMTLPASAAFHLKASGNVGSIVSNFTEVQEATDSTNGLQVDVGHANSGITLNLDLNDTALILQKGI